MLEWLVPVAVVGFMLLCLPFVNIWSMQKKLLICPQSLVEKDLSGKTFVVTGGSSGLGFHTVVQLAKQGARVIVGCRRVDDARVDRLREAVAANKRGSIDVKKLDLSSLVSVREFAALVSGAVGGGGKVHGLVNNAGIMNCPLRRTAEGHEMQFATNYLGHFLLTQLLLPQLSADAAAAGKGRVVNISSCTHHKPMGKSFTLEVGDLGFERKKYNGWVGYGHSKLAQVLHAEELAKRHGAGVVASSLHPGSCFSNITRHMMGLGTRRATAYVERMLTGQISSWMGIQTALFCLLADEGREYPTRPGGGGGKAKAKAANVGKVVNGRYYSQAGSPYGYARGGGYVRGGWPVTSENPQAADGALRTALFDASLKAVAAGAGAGAADSGASGSSGGSGSASGSTKSIKVRPA